MHIESFPVLLLNMESGHDMSYLYKLYIVIEDDSDNLFYQNVVDDLIEKTFKNQPKVDYVGATISELDEKMQESVADVVVGFQILK